MVKRSRLLLAWILVLCSPQTHAVAFCALRDPVNTIYELFPEADAYRSSVKTVGRDARSAVLNQLPFALHFNELGRHTLYVALQEGETVGYVHARSEMGEWGITEYAWALSPDLRIRGVKVQRSRDPVLRGKSAALSAIVRGKDLAALEILFKTSSDAADKQLASLASSAMKTIVITENVWADEISPVGAYDTLEVSRKVFPEAIAFSRIAQLYDSKALAMLSELDLAQSPVFDRAALTAYTIQREDGATIAIAVHSPFELDHPNRQLLWIVSAEGDVELVYNRRTNRADQDFSSVVGYTPKDMKDCSTVADIAALEVSTVALRHLSE